MYLNSMFDFSMYNLHGQALAAEAAGTRILLRDNKDDLVLLCNDGNHLCNVTNFDWLVKMMNLVFKTRKCALNTNNFCFKNEEFCRSKKAARDLWTDHVIMLEIIDFHSRNEGCCTRRFGFCTKDDGCCATNR